MGLVNWFLVSMMVRKGRKAGARLDHITGDAIGCNKDFLFKTIAANKDTEYGLKNGFANIRTVDDFKTNVPFSDYNTYAEAIGDMSLRGEGNKILAQPPVCFAATSGSVANPKAIPVSRDTLETYKTYVPYYGYAVLDRDLREKLGRPWRYDKILNLLEVRANELPCGLTYGPISGFAVRNVKKLLPYIITTPVECVFAQEKLDSTYVHVRFALAYANLSGIISSFMTGAVDAANYLRANWEMLVEDIEKGIINEDIHMSREMRSRLMARVKPDPKRAAFLRRQFEKGMDGALLKRIWPNLSFVYAIGSGGFAAYTKKMRDFIGDVPIYNSVFAASEALMAVCTEIESDHYTLVPDSAFYEFIPLESTHDPSPATLTLDQIKVGENYELVITNSSGFYRYRIQDVVKVMGHRNGCPQIQFAFRLNQMVSIAGEKTNDEHFRWAIQEMEKGAGCSVLEYSVYPDADTAPGRYVVLLETNKPVEKDKRERTRRLLEEKLCAANPSFGAKVKAGKLGQLEVKYVQPQTYALYRDLMVMRGISGNQIKPVRVIDTLVKERFFFALLEE